MGELRSVTSYVNKTTMITRGELRTYIDQNNNSEVFDVLFKGVEFGVSVYPDQGKRIAIFTVS